MAHRRRGAAQQLPSCDPRHITVTLHYGVRQFRLTIVDDGKGIEAATIEGQQPVGHFGLPGMRERAAVIGGQLDVRSAIGRGTEIELRVPGRNAYDTAGHTLAMGQGIPTRPHTREKSRAARQRHLNPDEMAGVTKRRASGAGVRTDSCSSSPGDCPELRPFSTQRTRRRLGSPGPSARRGTLQDATEGGAFQVARCGAGSGVP